MIEYNQTSVDLHQIHKYIIDVLIDTWVYNGFCMFWCANSQHFWIRTRGAKCSLLSNKTTESPWFPGLTPMSVMHSSLSRKCFQADPRAQACSMAATLPPQRTYHRRNMQAMHMRYRHQQCPAPARINGTTDVRKCHWEALSCNRYHTSAVMYKLSKLLLTHTDF